MKSVEYLVFSVLRFFRKISINPFGFGNSTCFFADFFKGFDKLPAVQGIFGDKTSEVLRLLKVEFTWFSGYMYVDDTDGHIVISRNYLNSGDRTFIYLDLIHELYHVKQFMNGRELFDPKFSYVDRPTEIEAYRYTVEEAKRIGLSNEQILFYLKTEWITSSDLDKLTKNIGLKRTEDLDR